MKPADRKSYLLAIRKNNPICRQANRTADTFFICEPLVTQLANIPEQNQDKESTFSVHKSSNIVAIKKRVLVYITNVKVLFCEVFAAMLLYDPFYFLTST
jgi:hypothetical protein